MRPDDLKAIWICYECKRGVVFHSDASDHEILTGHKLIKKAMMASAAETLASSSSSSSSSSLS
jgi:hypothetical protein